MTESHPVVTLFGTSKAGPGDEPYELAYEAGRALASEGYVIANGGYGGTMLASAKGARQVGGQVIGVTCSALGRSGPNPFITREILTSSLEERLAELIRIGSAYIVLPGGTGTLLELAHVWELKNKSLAGTDKPIIIWESFWKPLIERMKQADPNCDQKICTIRSIKDIMPALRPIR
jgi:uncharacterized protein (TIGR00725 family)